MTFTYSLTAEDVQEVKAAVCEMLADESAELYSVPGSISHEQREAIQDWLHGMAAEYREGLTWRAAA